MLIHGYSVSDSPKRGLYQSWRNMKGRVIYRKEGQKSYDCYKGKAISMDSSWLSFEPFRLDMEANWFPNSHLHRLNSDDNYYRDNCVWLPAGEHITLHNRLNKETRIMCRRGHPITDQNIRIHNGRRECRICEYIASSIRKGK